MVNRLQTLNSRVAEQNSEEREKKFPVIVIGFEAGGSGVVNCFHIYNYFYHFSFLSSLLLTKPQKFRVVQKDFTSSYRSAYFLI